MVKITDLKPPIERIIEEFLPRINQIANKYAYLGNPVLSKEDLVSAGIIGLIEAYHRFDPSKKVNFRTYAEFRIKGAILDEIRKIDIIPRSTREKISELEEKIRSLHLKLGRMPEEEEIAEAMGLTLEEYQRFLENVKGISFLDIESLKQKMPDLEDEDIFEFIPSQTAKTDPFENYVLKELQAKLEKALNYLSEKEKLILTLYYYEDLNMKEIAKILEYTEGRISQLHNQAIMKLRSLMNKEL
ncbi:MAG: FliA/WhiG family RNA polymerase sigma factor [Caldimicrobium sp.]|nr:FliA/WhiG family RNA polymerase sigma factor [Caldimicrobium sp.]MCX7613600.1 FliA/WhiG family RNA polymerase sigma factor [Caldimicrobium sp.]MDW8183079.1 FliA/WhiG family RNA polymerase sigma factor [Caldimicrobium sp.]